jgi:hypothetical protein
MKYTVRVELHGATGEDYETLHSAMEDVGFLRYIADSDGTKYELPTAEYNWSGQKDKHEVRNLAKRAAATTGLEYSILVTKSDGRTWHNLKQTN